MLLINIFASVWRYIFESKESKQGDSKGNIDKDAKGEKSSQGKVVARLQVHVIQVIWFIRILLSDFDNIQNLPAFKNSLWLAEIMIIIWAG